MHLTRKDKLLAYLNTPRSIDEYQNAVSIEDERLRKHALKQSLETLNGNAIIACMRELPTHFKDMASYPFEQEFFNVIKKMPAQEFTSIVQEAIALNFRKPPFTSGHNLRQDSDAVVIGRYLLFQFAPQDGSYLCSLIAGNRINALNHLIAKTNILNNKSLSYVLSASEARNDALDLCFFIQVHQKGFIEEAHKMVTKLDKIGAQHPSYKNKSSGVLQSLMKEHSLRIKLEAVVQQAQTNKDVITRKRKI